ncbi:MAG: DNA adenine methylase [Filifactoraceae bacterium]
MNSFIGWVGGKRALREVIVEKFPKERTRYIEVFGGAGWVYFHKEEKSGEVEVFNDYDKELINLYRCIKYHKDELSRELLLLPSAREIFMDFKNQIKCSGFTDIQRAARYFYLIKISFGNTKKSFATKNKSVINTLERFDLIQSRLKNTVIENKDFEKLIRTYDRAGALFYCDPPYYKTEHYYNDKFAEADHERLRDVLKPIKGKFILSYNDDQKIRDLYQEFKIEEVIRKNQLSAGSNSKDYKELIITNY